MDQQIKIVVMRLVENPDPKKQRIITPSSDIILLKGNGDTNMFCGKCKNLLAQEINPMSIKGIVVQCFKCKSFNVAPVP